MNINPVLEKELKRNTRSMRISWVIFGSNLMLALIAFTCFFGESRVVGYLTPVSYSMPMRCYMLMAYALFFLTLLVVPSLAGSSISLEREQKTLDVLLTTNLNPWKIITGKLESFLGIIFVLTVSSMPVISLVMIFGGIGLIDIVLMMGALLVVGIFIGSMGILCSVLFRKTALATAMSYMMVLAFTVGTVGVIALVYYVLNLRASSMNQYGPQDVGPAIYLLFLNPFLSFAGLISRQLGTGHEIADICNLFGDYSNNPLISHMTGISVNVQLLLSAIFLRIAGHKMNPLNK